MEIHKALLMEMINPLLCPNFFELSTIIIKIKKLQKKI